ncbi:MAG: hypothetical protein ACP5QO_03310 [Clostridia bacterium]
MAYTLWVQMRDETGALARLTLLLHERRLAVDSMSVRRAPHGGDQGRLTVALRIQGDDIQAVWAARQLTRIRLVEEVRVVGAPAETAAVREEMQALREQGSSAEAVQGSAAGRSLYRCRGGRDSHSREQGRIGSGRTFMVRGRRGRRSAQ